MTSNSVDNMMTHTEYSRPRAALEQRYEAERRTYVENISWVPSIAGIISCKKRLFVISSLEKNSREFRKGFESKKSVKFPQEQILSMDQQFENTALSGQIREGSISYGLITVEACAE